MKVILAVALLVACTSALEMVGENGLIKFDFDSQPDSLIGLVMSGQIDPHDDTNNKIETFLKLANYYVPLLDSVKGEENSLKWWRTWNFALPAELGSIWFNGTFELIAGWGVYLNENNLNMTTDYLDVAYVPFVWGWTSGELLGQTWPWLGSFNATLWYVRAYTIVNVEVHNSGSICFGGSGHLWPIQLEGGIVSELKYCKAEILTQIINGIPINLGCGYSAPVAVPVLNQTFTQNYTQPLVDRRCFNQ